MKFYRITKRDFILTAPERWDMLHAHKKKSKVEEEISKALRGLDLETACEADVTRIVGHGGLTGLCCDVCRYDIDEALIYEDGSQEPHSFCKSCFGSAVGVFQEMGLQKDSWLIPRQRRLSIVKA